MRTVFIVALLISALACPMVTARPALAAECRFVLGFEAVHDLIPNVVGDCLVDEHHNPENGDGLQETTGSSGGGGLLVWRKADNFTAFTDGHRSWVNGPCGLQQRLNAERFDWELAAGRGCVAGPGGTQYSVFRVTLHPVREGTAVTLPVAPEQFPGSG
jgi:hypothetical protein